MGRGAQAGPWGKAGETVIAGSEGEGEAALAQVGGVSFFAFCCCGKHHS